MKKSELKELIKECIVEVLNESAEPDRKIAKELIDLLWGDPNPVAEGKIYKIIEKYQLDTQYGDWLFDRLVDNAEKTGSFRFMLKYLNGNRNFAYTNGRLERYKKLQTKLKSRGTREWRNSLGLYN